MATIHHPWDRETPHRADDPLRMLGMGAGVILSIYYGMYEHGTGKYFETENVDKTGDDDTLSQFCICRLDTVYGKIVVAKKCKTDNLITSKLLSFNL